MAFPTSPMSPVQIPDMLFYNFNSSRGQVLRPSSFWSVRDIKEEVEKRENVPADSLRVIYRGTELEDNKHLKDCKLDTMSTVHVLKSDRRSSSALEAMAKPKNQFYVYCAECKSIAEGKIIIRCSECMQQSFVVKKGPKSWDEVLVKQTDIHGSCLNESCKGKDHQGKYTFHCSAHRGSDIPPEALPLPLLRVNTVSIKCMNCAETQDPVLVFPCNDHHAICMSCFEIYVELAINSQLFERDPRTEMYTLGCPAGCPDSYIPEPHTFKAARPDLYERYKDIAVEDMVLKCGGVVCSCGQKIMCSQFDESESEDDDEEEAEPQAAAAAAFQPQRLSLKCDSCKKTYCTRCKQLWHPGDECTAPAPKDRPKDEMRIEKEKAAMACWKTGYPDPCIEAFQKDLQEAKKKWEQSHKKKRWWLFSS